MDRPPTTSRPGEPVLKEMMIMTNQEYAAALRQVADWFEAHPEVPAPLSEHRTGNSLLVLPEGKEGMAAFARAIGTVEKEVTDYCYILRGQVAGLAIRAVEMRDAVCERVVLGKETVTEKVPVQFEERTVEREIVEWRCSSLLAEVAQ